MAVPTIATAAILAYLNARWRIPVDFENLSAVARAVYQFRKREKKDRVNPFYIVEENALSPKIADKPFILYENQRWTFKQFYDSVLRYAGWLHSIHHVAQGEVVAIDFMNGPEILFLAVAVWSLGATPALINYNLLGESLVHSVRISSARLLIVEPEVANNVLTPETKAKLSSTTFRNNALPIEVVVLEHSLQTSLRYFKPYRAPDSARSGMLGRTPAVLISTSGTTGLPKQAVASASRLVCGALCVKYVCGMQPVSLRGSDTFYSAMPLYHGTAFIVGFGMCMVGASTFAIGRRFSVSNFWSEVNKYNATGIQYVGEVLRYLVTAPVHEGEQNHHVRFAFGNGLRPDVWKRFKVRFGIETVIEFYGATEGTFVTSNVNRNDFSDGAVANYGKAVDLLLRKSLAVVNLDWVREEPWRDPKTGFCAKVIAGEPGELIHKLDAKDPHALFPGYYNNEKATQEKILRNVFEKGDVWFRTGDVLRWDTDGRMWFSDRIGDTFRWKSENVSTTEVGEILGYHPDVLEANVYGVSVPGHEGRAGCVALLLKDSAWENNHEESKVKPEVLRSLATYSRNSLQKVAVPIFLRIVSKMEATGNHKPIKHILRSQGTDLQIIREAGGGDEMYWLPPGAERYTRFEPQDEHALSTGKARL